LAELPKAIVQEEQTPHHFALIDVFALALTRRTMMSV